MLNKIVLINYGAGNMASVRNALAAIDQPYLEVSTGPLPSASDHIYILPGVGSFAEASRALQVLNFETQSFRSVKLIGICLGMQLLFTDSTEGGFSHGLSLISGNIRPIRDFLPTGSSFRLPHVGWQELDYFPQNSPFSLSPFVKHDFYFVHSFMATSVDPSNIIASVEYGGISIPAIVGNKSVIGFQFHPEKSGHHGLTLLREAICYLDIFKHY